MPLPQLTYCAVACEMPELGPMSSNPFGPALRMRRLYLESVTQRSRRPSPSMSSDTRPTGDFLERAVVLVVEEKILRLVVSNVDVGIAVAIVVGCGHAHGAALVGADPRFVRHVRECSVAIVVVEAVRVGGVVERAGIVVGGVEGAVLGIELHVAPDEQVNAAIAIVIQPGGADGPSVDLDAGLDGHVSECPITIVVVENRFAIAGHQEIHKTIVVKISGDRSRTEDICRYAGLVGDIRERTVAVVFV